MRRRTTTFISGVLLPTALVASFGAFMIVFSGYSAEYGADDSFPRLLIGLGIVTDVVILIAALTLVRHYRERLRLEGQIDEERAFASVVAHQLRQSLTAIAWSVDAALEPSVADSQRLDALRSMRQSVTRGTRTVSALLRAARLENGSERVKRESVPLAMVVDEAWAQAKERDPSKRVVFTSRVSPEVVAVLDADLTIEVLRNIFDNAVVHGPTENSIDVRALREGTNVILSVADHGYGIRPDLREKMFVKGARDDSSQGTGLGLYLTKGLMEMMGGGIAFDSSPQGTTFRLTFPAANA